MPNPLAMIYLKASWTVGEGVKKGIKVLKRQFQGMKYMQMLSTGLKALTWTALAVIFYRQYGSRLLNIYSTWQRDRVRAKLEKFKVRQVADFDVSSRKIL